MLPFLAAWGLQMRTRLCTARGCNPAVIQPMLLWPTAGLQVLLTATGTAKASAVLLVFAGSMRCCYVTC